MSWRSFKIRLGTMLLRLGSSLAGFRTPPLTDSGSDTQEPGEIWVLWGTSGVASYFHMKTGWVECENCGSDRFDRDMRDPSTSISKVLNLICLRCEERTILRYTSLRESPTQ